MQQVNNNICKAYQINDVWVRSGPSVAVTTLLLYDGFQHCPSTYDLRARAAPSMVAAAAAGAQWFQMAKTRQK